MRGVVALAWNFARILRAVELMVPGDFFSTLMTLCHCILHVLRHFVQWKCCIQGMCSRLVPCHASVFCNTVSADRSGMAAPMFLVAAAACIVLLHFSAWSRKSQCNGSVRMCEWCCGSRFFRFWQCCFSFYKSFLISASDSSLFRFGVEIRFKLFLSFVAQGNIGTCCAQVCSTK